MKKYLIHNIAFLVYRSGVLLVISGFDTTSLRHYKTYIKNKIFEKNINSVSCEPCFLSEVQNWEIGKVSYMYG